MLNMAGEMRRLEFAATTLDVDHWHPGWRAAAAAAGSRDYHDWVFQQLRDVMLEAGAGVHPDAPGPVRLRADVTTKAGV